MKLEILIKVSSLIAAMIGVGKFIYEMNVSTKPRLWGEYESTKKFFNDLENEPKLHPFVKAKGYQAIAGTGNIANEEIAYLLSLEEPEKRLMNYKFSKKYLIFDGASNDPYFSL